MTTKSEGMMIPGKLKWYVILALALWLVFSGVAAAEQLYANESGWWRDGGAFNVNTAPIQAAVDAAGAGDAIFVHGGNYYENVDVDKPRLTLEGAGADVVTVRAADEGDHVFEVTADYVGISGFTATGAMGDIEWWMTGSGIRLTANHCRISDNNVLNNSYGISICYSNNNTLLKNTISNNSHNGIKLTSSSNNTLTNNALLNNSGGINLDHSSNNMLMSNNCSNNSCGINLDHSSNNTLTGNNCLGSNINGILLGSSNNNTLVKNVFIDNGLSILEDSYHNSVENNTVNGKPLVYLEDATDCTITNAGQVILVNCNNITAKDLNLSNTTVGIKLLGTDNSTIINTTNSNNGDGIDLRHSNNNTLSNNNCSNNYYGILIGNSNNNTLANNTANSNKHGGIHIGGSNNTLTNNTANSNVDDQGISLHSSSNNMIASNNCSNNCIGIELSDRSNNNMLINNTILNNGCGIELFFSSNNTLMDNNCLNNSDGIELGISSNNTLTKNVFIDDGLFVSDDSVLEDSYHNYHNNVEDNTVNGKPLVYLEDATDCTITNAGQVILVNCNNITAKDLNLSNTTVGIELLRTDNSVITNNTASNNRIGICLYSSSNNTITSNTASNNGEGIFLWDLNNNNTIYHNNLINNIHDNAYDHSGNNRWDSGSVGNYYSDYTGTDRDGIGDTTHPIHGGNSIDRFPLVQPWISPQKCNLTGNGEIIIATETPADAKPIIAETNVPGFGAVFVIAELLAITCFMMRRQE